MHKITVADIAGSALIEVLISCLLASAAISGSYVLLSNSLRQHTSTRLDKRTCKSPQCHETSGEYVECTCGVGEATEHLYVIK